MMSDLLAIRGLNVHFETTRGRVRALRDVTLSVPRDTIVGVVGESGSGKSTVISAVLRLLANNAVIASGEITFDGTNVLAMSEDELRHYRGQRVAAVFQDPMTAFSPVHTIATVMTDILYRDAGRPARSKRLQSIEALRQVGLPDPAENIDQYPHQFSGGMRQRIAISLALLVGPALLIADEPTTALDVTLEAQIIHLLRALKARLNGSILFVSHNLGLVAELCDCVVVMYAGEVVETAPVRDLFHSPSHPYTRLLIACDPASLQAKANCDLPTIGGEVPDLVDLPSGCIFADRCPSVTERCRIEAPRDVSVGRGHVVRCHLAVPHGV